MDGYTRAKLVIEELARQAAKALEYKAYYDGQLTGVIGSFGLWYDATYKAPSPKRVKSYGVGQPKVKRIILSIHSLIFVHPDYFLDIGPEDDGSWCVYSTGDISDIELQLMPLMEDNESPWSRIEEAWYQELDRRKGLLRQKWDKPSKPIISQPEIIEARVAPTVVSSTRIGLEKVLTYGDLGLTLKQ